MEATAIVILLEVSCQRKDRLYSENLNFTKKGFLLCIIAIHFGRYYLLIGSIGKESNRPVAITVAIEDISVTTFFSSCQSGGKSG